jgi:hypothetical protein
VPPRLQPRRVALLVLVLSLLRRLSRGTSPGTITRKGVCAAAAAAATTSVAVARRRRRQRLGIGHEGRRAVARRRRRAFGSLCLFGARPRTRAAPPGGETPAFLEARAAYREPEVARAAAAVPRVVEERSVDTGR